MTKEQRIRKEIMEYLGAPDDMYYMIFEHRIDEFIEFILAITADQPTDLSDRQENRLGKIKRLDELKDYFYEAQFTGDMFVKINELCDGLNAIIDKLEKKEKCRLK